MAYKPGNNQATAQADQPATQAGSLLQLLIEQLDAAMTDNNDSMKILIGCHQKIAEKLKIVQQAEVDNDTKSRIQQELNEAVMQMVVAFQQHDAFNQRLQHTIDGLAETKELIEDASNDQAADNWQQLEHKISSHYTTAREHQVHQLNQGKGDESPPSQNCDIELF